MVHHIRHVMIADMRCISKLGLPRV
ncbi:MAG: hypothetical protein UU84_C0034G0001, partial [Candidatus Yanofskybacteria bacterium GW2011_GWC2_41_9]